MSTQTKKKVLIVDDNQSDVLIAKSILEKVGLDVMVAPEGFSAINLFDTTSFALFVVDLQMPKMPGIELVKRIKRFPAYKSTPVLIMSGRNKIQDVESAVKAGAADYIVKPIDLLVMENKVMSLISSAVETWKEYDLGTKPSGISFSITSRVSSISEVGLTMITEFPVKNGSVINLEAEVFSHLKVGSIMARVESCTKQENSLYINKVSFVALKEEQRKKIRLYCMELWTSKGQEA